MAEESGATSTRRPIALRAQRVPTRPGRRLGRGRASPLPADELHQLERRTPRLAGAALLALVRPGADALAARPGAVRQWRVCMHTVARCDVGSVACYHRSCRSLARRAHHGKAAT